jgi:malonyl CoA-acyl carrier protein transacylase
MGAFLLKHYKAARETWEEAEEVRLLFARLQHQLTPVQILGGFDRWRKSLDLLSAPELSQLELADWEPWQKDRAPDQLRKIVFGGAPQSLLTKSSNAQPAILITSLAFLRVVEKELKIPLASQYASVFLGHSSGEFAACAAAGAMSFEDALRISVRESHICHLRLIWCRPHSDCRAC